MQKTSSVSLILMCSHAKEGLVYILMPDFLVVLSQHVQKTSNSISLQDFRISCDVKVMQNTNCVQHNQKITQ